MNVLQVNYIDLSGRRFSGFDLMHDLSARGVRGAQAVLHKLSDDPDVFSLLEGPLDPELHDVVRRAERRYSMHNLLSPWGRILQDSDAFRRADVAHYHLIHGGMLSLLDVRALSRAVPSVWTLHDPWMLTGHCIHPPGGCTGWLSGCTPCPHLDALFPMLEDRAGQLWSIKRRVLAESDLDIVVASEFMLDMVRKSPITRECEHVHLVPFGIDARVFLPDEHKAASRELLGIPPDDFVILCRSADTPFKGVPHILAALGSQAPSRPTTLVTVDQKGLMGRLAGDYTVVDLGWVEDPARYPHLFSACDVFLMPSTAESFGYMALEAMAAGRPVVCFADTAVASVTMAPECGLAVPLGDASALRVALDDLAQNPQEMARRGALGRELARTRYSHDSYLDALTRVYESVRSRRARS